MSRVVLDASALLAMLRVESGGERVAAVLHDSAMTTVNVSEVVQHYARRNVAADDIRQRLASLPFARVSFDEELAYRTAMLSVPTRHAGLSLGDRACLALARHLGTRALTADRAWSRVADAVGVEIELIR